MSMLKVHSTPTEAYRCKARYLTKVLGYKRLDSAHCFQPPDIDGEPQPILVLTRPGRFGGVMRAGKGGGEVKAKRIMPHGKGVGGTVASY